MPKARFAHLADVHLGGWRDEKLKELGMQSFSKAVDIMIQANIDFAIIAGDFFNTALPSLDAVKLATKELARLKKAGIPVYIISGSHDYSPSGKTMLDVLENAMLVKNVQKARYGEDGKIILEFTIDDKTGIKLAGLPGKKGALEVQYYENLDYDAAEKEPGRKIFLFHMLLTEFKRTRDERIETLSSSALPKGFMYYAGGHPHLVDSNNYSSGIIAYPGPIFPNNYEELEELKKGGFYIVEEEDGKINNVEWESLAIKNVKILDINCNNISAEQLNDLMLDKIRELQLLDTILLLRVKGKLSSKATEIDWVQIYKTAQSRGCYSIARNISKMSAEGREEIELDYSSRENLESEMISEFESKTQIPKVLGHNAIRKLLLAFSEEKKEGETNADFQSRLKESFDRQFNINNSNDADTETSSNNEDNKNINTLESTN